MKRPGWVLAADARRAAKEAGLLAFALTLPVAALFASLPVEDTSADGLLWAMPTADGYTLDGNPVTNSPLDALLWGPVAVMIVVAPFAALRRRRPVGARWHWQRREVARSLASLAVIWLSTVLAQIGGAGFAASQGWTERETPDLLITVVAFGAPTLAPAAGIYGIWRGVVLAWPRWDRRRRTRLLWAMTHAQLVGSLALTTSVGAVLAAVALVSLMTVERPSPRQGTDDLITSVATLTQQMVPVTIVFFLASLVVGTVVVPPVALLSARVLRRASRRLEDLADGTAALRSGNLAARVPVTGEDEVARLQTDFNAMAADLERSHADLSAERDAVARLLADRRELVAAVSHELRTPVATLRGYLDSALGRWNGAAAPPPGLREDLATMAAETVGLGRLIDDLFALARAELGQLPIVLRPTDAAVILCRVAAAVAPLAWERGRVEVLAETPPHLPSALVDPDRLEQALRNLVGNAVRHTPPGGVVLLAAAADRGTVLIQVKDTGEGVSAEDLAHVWERFYRADCARASDGGGAGLGLALVKELTEAMGGSVAAESAPGAGSCFALRLPVAPPLALEGSPRS